MKLKRKIISIILSFILMLNVPLLGFTSVFADDAIATQNPLFIPITSLVTAVALGSGIIAKNSADAISAGNQLVNNVISNIKSSEVQKTESDASYDSPYRVINGGQPEKPNNNNKNGTWVALGGGAIASGELWANKDTVIDIMQKINNLGGYNQNSFQTGIISSDNFKASSSASNVALQLAKISNSAVKQFDDFLHSDTWLNQGFNTDDCYFAVNVKLSDVINNNPIYPALDIHIFSYSSDINYVKILGNSFNYAIYNNGDLSYGPRFYSNGSSNNLLLMNEDMVGAYCDNWQYGVSSRNNVNNSLSIVGGKAVDNTNYYNFNSVIGFNRSVSAFCGYCWVNESPFQFTNNVYNVNMQFDENFQSWMQEQIQLLGQGLMDAVKLGITTTSPTWNPTQEQIQTGATPASVIYQYINNYENPENIPEDEPSIEPNPEPDPEPETEAEPATENMVDEASQSLFDWALSKITLPDGIWEKIPFSIPYDTYLLIKAILPSRQRQRKLLTASLNSVDNPNGITISSHYEASGADVRSNQAVFEVPSKWSQNAPVINWDLHFTYTDVSGQTKTLDYVKTVDLAEYAYFAMIIYIGIYVSWMGTILGFIFDSFK